ncbi:hypothetical protein HC928_09350 [bacterium]|nr:hypothetical protein [bacterium]
MEIFVVNESNVDVWFDDLKIEFEGALIAQETHYDPWGLELAGIGKTGLDRFTFNAQSEKQKDLNGGKGYFYETDFRGYDPQLGRFHGYDLLASAFSGITPYQFGFNNPVSFNDPTGLCPECPTGAKEGDEYKSSGGAVYHYTDSGWVREGGSTDVITVEAKREDGNSSSAESKAETTGYHGFDMTLASDPGAASRGRKISYNGHISSEKREAAIAHSEAYARDVFKMTAPIAWTMSSVVPGLPQ